MNVTHAAEFNRQLEALIGNFSGNFSGN